MKTTTKKANTPKIAVRHPANDLLDPGLERAAGCLNAVERIRLAKKLSLWSSQMLESALLMFDESN